MAITTPLAALIPSEVWPDPTAVSACSICTSLPDGLKVVREKEYWLSPMAEARDYLVGFFGAEGSRRRRSEGAGEAADRREHREGDESKCTGTRKQFLEHINQNILPVPSLRGRDS